MPSAGWACRSTTSASSRGTLASCTSTQGFSGRLALTLTTSAKRSSLSCTVEPGGYTPIILMKVAITCASNFGAQAANSNASASWGVNALAARFGLHRLS